MNPLTLGHDKEKLGTISKPEKIGPALDPLALMANGSVAGPMKNVFVAGPNSDGPAVQTHIQFVPLLDPELMGPVAEPIQIY
jgi:hypothetical protein